MVAPSITTTRASIPRYFWLWWIANYKFLWVDVDTSGSSSDAQIFNDCLSSGNVDGTLDIPDAEPLPGDDCDMPYFHIGDDAFLPEDLVEEVI